MVNALIDCGCGLSGGVRAVDTVSVERRRMAKAGRSIAELTRDQLRIIDGSGDTYAILTVT